MVRVAEERLQRVLSGESKLLTLDEVERLMGFSGVSATNQEQ